MTTSLLDQPVGHLARTIPGATHLFHEYRIDFCCGGQHSLRAVLVGQEAEAAALEAALEALRQRPERAGRDWDAATPAELIGHLLEHYHAAHRRQLPELIRLARRVEQVHGDRPACPRGLADHLEAMQQELESHMVKEEQILFPLINAGAMVRGPVMVMRHEHDDHGTALRRIDALTDDIRLPQGACNTWRALYTGLVELRDDLMQHIHLENNILFEKAVDDGAPQH